MKNLILSALLTCTVSVGFSNNMSKIEIENGTLYFNNQNSRYMSNELSKSLIKNLDIFLKNNTTGIKNQGHSCIPICMQHRGYTLGKPLVDEAFDDYIFAEQEGNVHQEETGHTEWIIWCGYYSNN